MIIFLDFLSLLLAHSTSNTFIIDTVGFHQITDVLNGDAVKVNFNSNDLRLFLFLPFNSYLVVDELDVDGANMSSQFHNPIDEEIGFAVDGSQYAQFNFTSRGKPKLKIESDSVSLWLIPRNLCSKSSYFESGGLSSEIISYPSNQSITSKSPYIQYSMCVFSPVFDFTEVSYSIKFGVEADLNNYVSESCLYTDNFNESERCVNNYDEDSKYLISNAFFIQHTIKTANENYKRVDNQVKIKLKRDTEKSNFSEFFDLFCITQPVDACNSTACVYDKELEDDLYYRCNTKLDDYFRILLIVFCCFVAVIIIITILCVCGCCVCCCGYAGCTCCACNIHHNKQMKQRLIDDDQESIKSMQQNDYYTPNPATPLVYPMDQQPQQYQANPGFAVPIVYQT